MHEKIFAKTPDLLRATVIIPTYNRCGVLGRAMESVLNQKFEAFELIVVDDGSTDATKNAVLNYTDARIIYMKRTNGGISAARNTGIAAARGSWITFLDDDDEALPEWLSTFDELLTEPTVGVVCVGAIEKQSHNGSVQVSLPRRLDEVYENVIGLFMSGTFACRTSLLQDVGGFASDLTCSHATELAIRLIPACHRRGLTVKPTNRILIQVNKEKPQNRPMSGSVQLLKGVNYILETHRDTVKRSPAFVSRYLGIAGVAAVRLGLYKESRRFFLKALLANPWSVKAYLRFLISLNRHLARHVWRFADFTNL